MTRTRAFILFDLANAQRSRRLRQFGGTDDAEAAAGHHEPLEDRLPLGEEICAFKHVLDEPRPTIIRPWGRVDTECKPNRRRRFSRYARRGRFAVIVVRHGPQGVLD